MSMKSAATAFAKAVGIYGSKTASASDIAAEISTLAGGQAQRETALAQAEEDRRVAVLSGNAAKVAAAETALATARREIEHAGILLDGLRTRLADAEAAEAEAVRQERYDRARALHDALLKEMPAIWKRLGTDARQLAERMAQAHELIEEANNDLPAGGTRIADPDVIIRGRLAADEEIVDARIVNCWCRPHSGRRLSDDYAARVQPYDDGRTGYLTTAQGVIGGSGGSEQVELRPFRRERYRASVSIDNPETSLRDIAAMLAPPQPPLTKADRPILERFTPA
ncbi:MAG: hypothetical protein LCH88_05345 [Proteobacteria bacterium]|nr:hypothetical protein [Pseudomonadota bacterium]